MTAEEFREKLGKLLTVKQLAIIKKEDTKLIDIEIKKLRQEYKKSLFKEMNENGKYKK